MHIQDLMASIYYRLLYYFLQMVVKSDRDQIDKLLFPLV